MDKNRIEKLLRLKAERVEYLKVLYGPWIMAVSTKLTDQYDVGLNYEGVKIGIRGTLRDPKFTESFPHFIEDDILSHLICMHKAEIIPLYVNIFNRGRTTKDDYTVYAYNLQPRLNSNWIKDLNYAYRWANKYTLDEDGIKEEKPIPDDLYYNAKYDNQYYITPEEITNIDKKWKKRR